ncbi:MAG TPA: DUF3012 domain-containing protein [Gammaproteobacteria bacterium]|jgi:hypothetical protein|nr:DUF3012 domain-containing protein [Gammaproteobacteria bacterium]
MSRLEGRLRGSRALTPVGVLTVLAACVLLASCAPKVGTPRWCEAMKQKARGDWTANEALDFARYCVITNNSN